MKTVNLSDFCGADDRELFALAIDHLRANPDTVLQVEPKVYNITTTNAQNAQRSVMNGDFTSNPQDVMFKPEYDYDIGLDFRGLSRCRIEAEGAVLLIDGFMEPVCIAESEDICVKGFTILHKRKPYSRGMVEDVEDMGGGLYKSLIAFDEDCPITENAPYSLRVLYYDGENEEPLLSDFDHLDYIDSYHAYSYDRFSAPPAKGMLYYTCHTYHSRPAVMIENSKNVTVCDLTVHNNCGMGFLGHRSENVTLDSCRVTPVSGDHVSTNTDASHFTSIKGELNLFNCIFEYHGDDFSNIHGYFQKILKRIGDATYLISDRTPTGIHAQVIDYPDVGDTMELCDLSTLTPLGHYTVTECKPLYEGKWQTLITLDRPLPENFEKLDLMDVTRIPKVCVRACSSLDHYARSLVIKARGVLVEDCYFRGVRETAITCYAEPFWGEGASPEDITIRSCRFENCCWIKDAPSAILASVPVHKNAYNAVKNVRIENNYIVTDNCTNAMRFCNVDGLYISGNTCICKGEPVLIESCTNVTFE